MMTGRERSCKSGWRNASGNSWSARTHSMPREMFSEPGTSPVSIVSATSRTSTTTVFGSAFIRLYASSGLIPGTCAIASLAICMNVFGIVGFLHFDCETQSAAAAPSMSGAGRDRSRARSCHGPDDNKTGNKRQRRDQVNRCPEADDVSDEPREQRPDGITEVAPEPVDAEAGRAPCRVRMV